MTVTLWDPVLAGEEVTVKFSNHATPAFGTPHLIRDLAGNPADKLEPPRSNECDKGAAL